MSVDIMSVITLLSVSCNILLGVFAWRRNAKTDDREDASQMTKIITKLDTIESTVMDIKTDSKSLRNEIQDIWKHIATLEARVKITDRDDS